MKKLNNKGFTLIELLAIIVILAIIMVVTIPTVLGSMNNARKNSLQNAADSASEWFAKQYELASMGDYMGGADTAFNTFVTDFKALSTKQYLTPEVLTAAGLSNADENFVLNGDEDDDKSYVQYNTNNGRICVHLHAESGGSFYVNSNKTDDDGNQLFTNVAESSGCEGLTETTPEPEPAP